MLLDRIEMALMGDKRKGRMTQTISQRWMSGLLECRDIREGVDVCLLSRLQNTVPAGGSQKLSKFGAVAALTTDELTVDVKAGPILVELSLALRAFGF
jgi:hypothetical protein